MAKRVNTFITWKGKEYAHIIGDEPDQYCDMCAFSNICSQVITKKIHYDNSPMVICEQLSTKENTNFSFFVESEHAKNYL